MFNTSKNFKGAIHPSPKGLGFLASKDKESDFGLGMPCVNSNGKQKAST